MTSTPSRGKTPGLPTNDGSFKASERADAGVSLAGGYTKEYMDFVHGKVPYDPPLGGGREFDAQTERCYDCDGHFTHHPGCSYYVEPTAHAPRQTTEAEYARAAKSVRETLDEFDTTGETPASHLIDVAWAARKYLREAPENADGENQKAMEALDAALRPLEERYAVLGIGGEPTASYSEKVLLVNATREALTRTDRSRLSWFGETHDGWKAKARASRQRSAESFERSDTDGYLSQWASDKMASKYDFCAVVAEQGGRLSAPALFDLDGNLVRAKEVETAYGRAWMLMDEDGNATGWFNPSKANTPEKRAVAHAKKGYRLGRVMAPMALNSRTGDPFRADHGFDADNEVLYVIGADGTHPRKEKAKAEGRAEDFNEWYD